MRAGSFRCVFVSGAIDFADIARPHDVRLKRNSSYSGAFNCVKCPGLGDSLEEVPF